MKMSLVVDGLRSDVVAVGELGDDAVAEAAERIAAVLDRSLPTRVLDLLSDVVAELSAELPEGRVEIRVAGDDVGLAYVEDGPAPGGEGDGDPSARITLRLSEGLKARVEARASDDGVSVNTFIARALERGTSSYRNPSSRGGKPARLRHDLRRRTAWRRHSRRRQRCDCSWRTRSASWPSQPARRGRPWSRSSRGHRAPRK
jgi:hypothetical protein